MPNTKKWSELRETRSKLTSEQRADIDRRARDESNRIARHLADLRKARHLSQVQVAEQLGTNQGAISRLEAQNEFFLSTLARYVEAVGGRLRLVAEFGSNDEETIEFDVAALLAEEKETPVPTRPRR